MLKNDRHTYRITWSKQDNEHLGLCAEFPSLSWLAPTPEAALKGIRQVVADVVADITKVDETACCTQMPIGHTCYKPLDV